MNITNGRRLDNTIDGKTATDDIYLLKFHGELVAVVELHDLKDEFF